MGAIRADKQLGAANGSGQPQTFWRRIAQTLDRLVVQRSRRAIPAMLLRRSKYDHDRCRRLMFEGSAAPAVVRANRARALRRPGEPGVFR
jgi:hypothetical protein